MQQEHKTILSEVFREVLMRFAFMFGEECQKNEIPTQNPDCIHSKISFNGYICGSLSIMTSADLCVEMSANVLGMDAENDECLEDSFDTLEELLNVVCGQFLTSAFGDEMIFDLSPPLVSIADSNEWAELLKSFYSLAFMVEDYPALLYMKIE